MESKLDNFKIGDYTVKEWEERRNQPPISSSVSFQDAEEMGFLHPNEEGQEQPQSNKFYDTLDNFGIEHPEADKQYEKLGAWDTTKDVLASIGTEASHILAPKEWELQYESRTKFGENMKYLYRYGVGTLGFLAGGEILAGIKGAGLLANMARGAGNIVTGKKMFNVTQAGLKAARAGKSVKGAIIGTKLAQGSFEGALAGALADFNLYRPEENEGHLADNFEAAWLDFLKTDENDTDIDAKLKNVVEGFVIGLGVGNLVEFGAKPLFKRVFKNIKAAKEGKEGAIEAVIKDQQDVEQFANTADLLNKVEELKAHAETNNLEASQLLIDNLHPTDNIEAQKMLKILEEGDEIFVHTDGSWDRAVKSWDSASKVSLEEYQKQLKALDEFEADNTAGDIFAGHTAIKHQDEAVKHTWTNRGWMGEHESLISTTPKGAKGNTKLANSITKNYKDKWQIDNNIKVEFVDGLTINGKQVEGTTLKTKYQGKATKTQQNAIDKKKLQIKKIEDKITMQEGGNAEISDPLDLLKEELRIAKNELKELEKVAKAKNKIPDITIKIDTNAQNPYATLRAELEHARDISKGEVPNQAEKHFSRYTGLNEGEVAPEYVYKKAQGKAKAINGENTTLQTFMNDGNIKPTELEYNKEVINGQPRTDTNITGRYNNRAKTPNDGLLGTRPSESDAGIRPFIRRSEDGSSNAGSIIHDPSPEFKAELEAKGKPINSYKELAANSDEDAASFISNFRASNEVNGKLSAQVYEYSPEEYKQMRLFTAENGQSGFALKPDGDIVSVFSAEKGSLAGLMKLAIQNGGNKLDCFDTILPKIYEKFDFVEVNRVKWNEKYKPKNWDKEFFKKYNNGEPDVVYMKLKQTPPPQPKPQQLKIDFNATLNTKQTSDEVINGVVTGELKPEAKADIEAIFNKVEQTDPDISGFTFEALQKDADKYLSKLAEAFDDDTDLTSLLNAFTQGDATALETYVRKQLTAVKLMADFFKKGQELKAKGSVDDDTIVSFIEVIKHLGDYITEIKSGFGRGLNSQKVVNTALESYGASRLSSWTKEGIRVYSEFLANSLRDIIALNFTRGTKIKPKELIDELLQRGLKDEKTANFTQFLLENDDITAYYRKELQRAFTKIDFANITEETLKELDKLLTKALTVPEYRKMFEASSLAPTKKGFWDSIKNWMDENGGVTSYYVHNLLSGIGSVAKNITSGAMNTLYFPARKLLTAIDPFIDQATKDKLWNEGWRTYKNMKTSFEESWLLAKEAFITGNGKLTDIGENTLNMNEGQFKGFHEWKMYDKDYYLQHPEKIWETLQNFHSLMTRAMGASDEFMSQLNYRAIARSKALQEAERLAEKVGKAGDENWINEEADKLFKQKFDQNGKPTDVEALNEARTILYQNDLDGTMYDYSKNEKVQMKEQTLAMKMASGIQSEANKHTLVKIMFPFVKTGTNILQMALDHNFIYGFASSAQRKLLMANTAEGALARSQCAFGCFSMIVGMMFAMNGVITGSAPTDPQERKALFATGWKPYSFKVGDTYISYQGYEPLHGMLGFAADWTNMWTTLNNPEDEKRVEHFLGLVAPTFVNNFLDKASFRTGLKQLDFFLNPEKGEELQKAAAQTAKGFLPNVAMVTNLRSAGTHDVMQPQTMYERAFYRYFPEGWMPMDYRRNVFGEKQNITGYIIGSASSQDGSPEEEALMELAKYGYSPSEIDDVIANTGLNISDFKDSETGRSALDAMKEEMSTLTIQGMTLREAVRELVTSEEYQLLPDGVDIDTGARWGASEDTKINAINDIFLMYKQRAKKNIMENGDFYTDSKGRTMEEAKDEIKMNRLEQLINLY